MSFQEIELTTCSFEETFVLGKKIGFAVFPGFVIYLTGDLGSGKTVFVKGLASGLQVPQDCYITSPTYTIINEYSGRYLLYHLDLYRLDYPADVLETGIDEIIFGSGIVAIEWADRLASDYLTEYLLIHFEIIDNESRKIFIKAYGMNYEIFIKKNKKSVFERLGK